MCIVIPVHWAAMTNGERYRAWCLVQLKISKWPLTNVVIVGEETRNHASTYIYAEQ
jgi:hypothetical protein